MFRELANCWPIALLCPALAGASPLVWKEEAGYRVAPLAVPANGHSGFTRLNPAELGIDFTNALDPARVKQFQNLMNGSGLAAADVDGDGLVDLYFCHKQAPNQLYRNLGNGHFENITVRANAGCTNQSSIGAVFADVDGDGAPDLLVSSFGGPHALLHNDGHGHFTDVTAAAGISGKSGSTSLALADLDGDGDLDLYWCNFGIEAILRDGSVVASRMVNGRPHVTGRYANRVQIVDGMMVELGDPDVVFLNDGHGRFTPLPWEKAFTDAAGKPAQMPRDFGLAVQIRDINGDGTPDIYVCNDFQTPDRLWLGDGRGHFREAAPHVLPTLSYASMGVDFADIDRDGRLDFFTVEMLSRDLRQHLCTSSTTRPIQRIPGDFSRREELPRNALYWNRGDGTWAEIACFAGVAATSWSWTPVFLDVDLDGWEDLLVSNGHLHDINNRDIAEATKTTAAADRAVLATKDQLQHYPALEPPKVAFRNRHDRTFEECSSAWGFNATEMAHGMITVDFDGDGDLDVVLNGLKGPPLIYRNESSAPRVAVRLKGQPGNSTGVGARITMTGGPVVQTQEMIAGGQYLSQSEPLRVFAAGTGAGPMTLTVDWRSGRRSVVTGVRANHEYEILEPAAGPNFVAPVSTPPRPLFDDVSHELHHDHTEGPFNDFEQQPLLPQRYSQLGAMVAWTDLDGDGKIDLVIGTGRGGNVAAFRGDGHGKFTAGKIGGPAASDDVLGWVSLPGDRGTHQLLGALANYETGAAQSPVAQRWTWQQDTFTPTENLPSSAASSGPIAAADVDGDGDLDVFIGARLTARRWPQPGGSRWFRNDGGRLVLDEVASRPFASVGPVSDALLVDLDGDGMVELVLACELGPIRIFRRVQETWQETTSDWGLAGLTGWWNSVAAGDFDGDGRIDLVAGNRGENSLWQVWGDARPNVTCFDSGDGSLAIVEAVQVGAALLPFRDRKLLATALPELNERFPTHAGYADAGVTGILRALGPTAENCHTLRASSLASHVLLQRDKKFIAKKLPAAAQWTPVFGLAVADFDGDGRTDVVLAQNQFSVRPEDSRQHSGRALWLRGDGQGGFTAESSEISGLAIDGEQRGAAAADFDEDGRPDVVITQNASSTRLYRNAAGKPGWRIRLQGPPGNPDGIGAIVRAGRAASSGPAIPVTAGGGYGCQASPIVLLPGDSDAVEVHWPGGKISRTALSGSPRTIQIPHP